MFAVEFGGGADELMLANPIAEDLSTMRPCLLPNLLEAAIRNHHRGFKNLRLAEAGLAYRDSTPEGQQNIAAALLTGTISANHVQEQLFKTIERNIDAMDAKADALSLLGRLGIKKFELSATAPQWYHPGRSGTITLGSKIILAYFGELHPALLKEYDLETPAAAFEIMLDNIPNPRLQSKAKPPLKISDYQEVKRDFAFVVENEVTAASLVKAVENADKNLITDIKIFDVYSGKGIEEGKKSIALQVTLQSENHTLTDAEITAAAQAIISSVEKSTKGVLRS